MAGPSDEDRYQPLPGLFRLPAFLYRKLSRRGRRVAIAIVALDLAVLAAFALLVVPGLVEDKEEGEAARAERLAEERADRVTALREEQRLMRGEADVPGLTGSGGELRLARDTLLQNLVSSIEDDARQRVEEGTLEKEIEHVECEPFPRTEDRYDPANDPAARRGRYECVAVTAVIEANEATTGGLIGYPFRALVDFRTGRYAWCKISGHPGEGGFTYERQVGVPRECGGSD